MLRPSFPPAPPLEAAAIVTVCFGWFILISINAVASGFPTDKFSDSSFLSLIFLEGVLGAVALLILRSRGYLLSALLPSPGLKGCAAGILVYVVAVVASQLAEMPFASIETAPQPIDLMLSDATPSLAAVIALAMVNGLYEEVFLLGYLVRGFGAYGASFALGLSLLVRVLYHLYQGPLGSVSVLAFGMVLSLFYWRTGELWPAVFAHTIADIVPFL